MNTDMSNEPRLAPIPAFIKEYFGERLPESFECGFFLEDVERYIFNQKLEKIKKASNQALFSKGLEVSAFVHMNESTYRHSFLQ